MMLEPKRLTTLLHSFHIQLRPPYIPVQVQHKGAATGLVTRRSAEILMCLNFHLWFQNICQCRQHLENLLNCSDDKYSNLLTLTNSNFQGELGRIKSFYDDKGTSNALHCDKDLASPNHSTPWRAPRIWIHWMPKSHTTIWPRSLCSQGRDLRKMKHLWRNELMPRKPRLSWMASRWVTRHLPGWKILSACLTRCSKCSRLHGFFQTSSCSQVTLTVTVNEAWCELRQTRGRGCILAKSMQSLNVKLFMPWNHIFTVKEGSPLFPLIWFWVSPVQLWPSCKRRFGPNNVSFQVLLLSQESQS